MTVKITTLVTGLLALLAGAQVVNAFSFSFSSRIQQCSNLSVTWEGGTPPYTLNFIPIGLLNPEVRTIVDETIPSGNTHSFQLRFPAGSTFIAMMSDATGVGTGGTSVPITVLDGPTADCLTTTTVAPLFYIYITPSESNPSQCGNVELGWNAANATNPVRLTAIVPGGESFSIPIPSSGQPFNWQVPFPQGTQYMIMGGDPRGFGTGGSSPMYTVQGGNNNCINQDSPSSTQAPAAGGIYATGSGGGTVTGVPGTSPRPSDAAGGSSGGGSKNIGPIVGGVLGGVAALLALLLLFLFLRRRRNIEKGKATRDRRRESVDLLNDETLAGGGAGRTGTAVAAAAGSSAEDHADDGTGQSLMSQIPAVAQSSRRSFSSAAGTDVTGSGAPIYAQYTARRTSAPSLPPLRLSGEETGTESGYAASTNQALRSVGVAGGTGARSSGQFPPSAFRNANNAARPETPSTSEDTSVRTPITNRASKQGLPPPGTLRPVNFIQHEDAGDVPLPNPNPEQVEEVVELPPSYTDVSKSTAHPAAPTSTA